MCGVETETAAFEAPQQLGRAERARGAGVFGEDQVTPAQGLQRAEGDVAEVADGRADDDEPAEAEPGEHWHAIEVEPTSRLAGWIGDGAPLIN